MESTCGQRCLPRDSTCLGENMSVKNELLKLLESNRDKDLSGEQIAKRLRVTRAAVWKAVQALQNDGYEIVAKNKVGYRLASSSDRLSPEGIGVFLKKKDHKVIVLPEVDSTNDELKRLAMSGEKEGLVVLSEKQSKGKGRRGRDFYSPEGSGIYMSLLFRPDDKKASDIILVTTQAAVAVAHAVSKVCKKEAKIKWVNDVYLDDKKICGILTEAVSDFESGGIELVIVGIGINVRRPADIPDDLKGVMGYIFNEDEDMPVSRNEIAAAVINELQKYYEDLPDRSFMKEYKDRSNVIGKRIKFGTPGSVAGKPGDDWRSGIATDIDDSGGLVVKLDDGSVETLHTGEISVRVTEEL